MFPQSLWPACFLMVTTGVVLSLAKDTDSDQCKGQGLKLEVCNQCATLSLGVSTSDCCSDYKLYKACELCASDPSKCGNQGDSDGSDASNQVKRDPFWKRGSGLDRRLAFWKRDGDIGLDDSEYLDGDKRAKYFLGKRAKYFLGKRADYGDGSDFLDDDDLSEDEKRAKYFLGKRAKYFLGKRAKYFLGKRDYEDDMPEVERRAKYFLGKRAKYFLGKRNQGDEYLSDADKRAKYFLGKRYDSIMENGDGDVDKRQKYFLGKRSAEQPQLKSSQ